MACKRIAIAPLLLAAAGTFGPSTASAETIAYYQWENGTAGAIAKGRGSIVDSSGNGLDGNPSGMVRYQAVGNPESTLAARFNGKAGRVWVKDDARLALTHSLTLEAYVYLRSREGGVILIRGDSRYDYDPYYMLVRQGDGVLQFLIEQRAGVASVLRSPEPLPLKRWVHVAGTLDDATGAQGLYVNGSLVASTVTHLRPFANLKKSKHAGLGIGGQIEGSPDQYYFHGSIDDVRISDVALDPSQFLPPP